jgi:hypothetical protein
MLPCAESSLTSDRSSARTSCSKGSSGWSIAGTTPRASRRCTTARSTSSRRSDASRTLRTSWRPSAACAARSACATPAGRPTAASPTPTPTRTPMTATGICLIHNGIIENYAALKTYLRGKGHVFKSQTDTEVLAMLIGELYEGDLEAAVQAALREVTGAYGIVVMCEKEPGHAGRGPQGVAADGGRGQRRVRRRVRRLGDHRHTRRRPSRSRITRS